MIGNCQCPRHNCDRQANVKVKYFFGNGRLLDKLRYMLTPSIYICRDCWSHYAASIREEAERRRARA
jgi:hypothetical protein